jgi:hypothetical protein
MPAWTPLFAAAWVTWRADRDGPGAALTVALLIALWPLLGIWGVAGLETGLATLACTGVAVGLVDRRGVLVGVGSACLAWLRPEAALPCLAALAMLGTERRRVLPAWAIAGGGALAVVAFRLALFAEPLPLSLAAKPPDLVLGLAYVGRALLIVAGGLGLVPLGLAAREQEGPGPRLVALLAVATGSIALAGGDWMPGFRLFVPWLPVAAWAMSGPVAQRWPARRGVAVLLVLGATAIPALAGGLALIEARAAGRTREQDGAALSAWLAEHGERVALVDVGYLAYAADLDVVDLGGVTDPAIARLPGGHADKRIDPGFLRTRAPDTIVLFVVDGRPQHPVERRVASMAWVASEMSVVHRQPYGPFATYVVLRR